MCDWSNWQFICEGRYDILLAFLIGIAFLCAGILMLFSFFDNEYRIENSGKQASRSGHVAFLRCHGEVVRSILPRKTK